MPEDKKDKPGIFFMGVVGQEARYPAWRYHSLFEPIIVSGTNEDLEAQKKGYAPPEEPITSVPRLQNYFHDLEDFNSRQLVAFARDEFEIEFPVLEKSYEWYKVKLIRAIWNLYQITPRHKGRMVLLAQSVKMNLDETEKAIYSMAENFEETETKEVWV